jgi:hypothetical protein
VQSERCLNSALRALLPHADVGAQLIARCEEAGLPTPQLIWLLLVARLPNDEVRSTSGPP